MALRADPASLPLAALDLETAGLITTDGPLIECEHPDRKPVQLEPVEGVPRHEAYGFPADPPAQLRRIEDTDSEACCLIILVEMVEPDLADTCSDDLDDLGLGVTDEAVYPALGHL